MGVDEMSGMPSFALIAFEVRAEREALIRHADAVDAKAGIVLGFAGAVAALGSQQASPGNVPGLGAAVLAAVAAMLVMLPRQFPTWELQDLRRYMRADPEFTSVLIVDTGILMVRDLTKAISRKARLLRWAVALLAAAALLTTVGTLIH